MYVCKVLQPVPKIAMALDKKINVIFTGFDINGIAKMLWYVCICTQPLVMTTLL